ncbi:MAG: YceI family protein [Pseudomonadota bacterium]
MKRASSLRATAFVLSLLAVASCGDTGSSTGDVAAAKASETPAATADLSEAWSLEAEGSHLAFVSIKADELAETHTFKGLSGQVMPDGSASVVIDLNSVETNVDIRNERMRELFFETVRFPEATVSASLPLEEMASLDIGERSRRAVPLTVDLHGKTADYEADVFVTRLSGREVLVETASPILTHADDFALLPGLAQLMELAGLESITPAVPVTVSLVFSQ